MLEMKVTKDTLSEYMDKLIVAVNDNKEKFLRQEADVFAEYPDIGRMYYTLQESLEKNRIYKDYGGLSEIDVLYTGALAKHSWWEFRDDHDMSKPPERDYAYYQETGEDKVAKDESAHHKWAIKFAVADFAEIYPYDVDEWLDEILSQISK